MKKINLFIIVVISLVLTGCGSIDFTKTETVTFYDLVVEIPKAFTIDNENSNSNMQFYSYNDKEKYNSCMFDLFISDYPKSNMREAIQEDFYDITDWSYSEKDINGYRWSIGYKENSVKYNQTYYVINKNGKEYKIGYSDFGSGEQCAEALKIIEESLKFN